MQDFPSNSHKSKMRSEPPRPGEQPEKIERVTSAEAVRRKKGLGQQFKETFVGGNARMAIEYMTIEVVVPAIQNTLIDAVQGGFERLIRGESGTRPRRSGVYRGNYDNVGHVNYQGMSMTRDPRPSTSRMLSRQSRARQEFDEIVIPNRSEAEEVIDRMFDILSRHGTVTVSELYEMTGIQSAHTDHKWGWTQLRGARVARLGDGRYVLDLPEPEALSN
jgi:hypothetical protein